MLELPSVLLRDLGDFLFSSFCLLAPFSWSGGIEKSGLKDVMNGFEGVEVEDLCPHQGISKQPGHNIGHHRLHICFHRSPSIHLHLLMTLSNYVDGILFLMTL